MLLTGYICVGCYVIADLGFLIKEYLMNLFV